MWTDENRRLYERQGSRYPSDSTDDEWGLTVFRAWSSITKTGASTRPSRTWCAAWRSRAIIAIGPDGQSSVGGTPADEDAARGTFRGLDRGVVTGDFVTGVTFLKEHENCTGKLGCVGFCWGSGMSNQLTVNSTDLVAAVVFYGAPPAAEDVAKIKVPLLLNHGAPDKLINPRLPDYEAALKANGVQYTLYMYEGANHAFHNDTSESRYNEAAAKLAWQRTLDFFNEHLKG